MKKLYFNKHDVYQTATRCTQLNVDVLMHRIKRYLIKNSKTTCVPYSFLFN